MVPAEFKSDASEERDLLRIRKPSKSVLGVSGLALVEAANLAGLLPNGTTAGVALATVAVGLLAMECVRRGR